MISSFRQLTFETPPRREGGVHTIGFELASALRANPHTAAIPVIALSAVVSADVIERGRAAGFHDFVAKFDRAGLVAALKEQSTDLHRAA